MKFRQGLNPSRENFSNTRDLCWAQPALEGYFNFASHVLETPQGEDKSDRRDPYAVELQFVLRKVLTETSTSRTELIIIILIAVEVIICLVGDAPELWDVFRPRNKDYDKIVEIKESSYSVVIKPPPRLKTDQ